MGTIDIKKMLVKCYLIFMLCVFPLYYESGYANILRAKRTAYLNITLIFLVFMLVYSVIERKQLESAYKILIGGLVFCTILILFPTLWTYAGQDSLLGLSGRYLGSVSIIMGLMVVLFVAIYFEWREYIGVLLCVGVGSVFLLQIINTFGFDILQMQQEAATNKQYFISTIGNINFNATFNTMLLPVCVAAYLLSRKKLSMILVGIVILLGGIGSVCCRSDSVYLGLGVMLLVLYFVVIHEASYIKKYLNVVIIWEAAIIITGFMRHILKSGYPFDGISAILTESKLLPFVMLITVIMRLGLREQLVRKSFFKIGAYILGGIVLLLVAGEVWEQLSLVMTDNWGNNRGYIWSRSIAIWKQLPVYKQIYGCGVNSVSYLYEEYLGMEMVNLYGARYIDAHNEILQVLLSLGVMGVIIYLGVFVGILVLSLQVYRSGNKNALYAMLCIPAYLAQGLVNNPQIATTPLIFIGLGIFLNIIIKTNR